MVYIGVVSELVQSDLVWCPFQIDPIGWLRGSICDPDPSRTTACRKVDELKYRAAATLRSSIIYMTNPKNQCAGGPTPLLLRGAVELCCCLTNHRPNHLMFSNEVWRRGPNLCHTFLSATRASTYARSSSAGREYQTDSLANNKISAQRCTSVA